MLGSLCPEVKLPGPTGFRTPASRKNIFRLLQAILCFSALHFALHVVFGELGDVIFWELWDVIFGELGDVIFGELGDVILGELGDVILGELGDVIFGELGDVILGELGDVIFGGIRGRNFGGIRGRNFPVHSVIRILLAERDLASQPYRSNTGTCLHAYPSKLERTCFPGFEN